MSSWTEQSRRRDRKADGSRRQRPVRQRAAEWTDSSHERPGPIVEDGVIAGNVYDKYGTRNPFAGRMVRGFLQTFDELVASTGAEDIHEVGCGEGYLTERLVRADREVRASDFSSQVIEIARKRIEPRGLPIRFHVRDLYELQAPRDVAELVVCCEVMEHLDDPERAIRVLASLANPWLLVSVPREPLWRLLNVCRGSYLSGLGNTPGHKQHWSTRTFRRLLQTSLDIVEIRKPLPWTMVLCRTRSLRSS